MTNLKEFAKEYEPPTTTKNIADLKEVSTDLDLVDDEFEVVDKKTGETKLIKQKIVIIDNLSYRVPNSVIAQLKIVLEDNPNLKKFKVRKSGTDLDTRYQLIPLME